MKQLRKNPKTGRVQVSEVGFEPTKTQQQFADRQNINNIMKRFNNRMDQIPNKDRVYTDLTAIPDYRQTVEIMNRASDAFMSLPAKTRNRFSNDPQELIQFLADPENRIEAEKLGLVNKRVEPPVPPKPAPNEPNEPKGKGGNKAVPASTNSTNSEGVGE